MPIDPRILEMAAAKSMSRVVGTLDAVDQLLRAISEVPEELLDDETRSNEITERIANATALFAVQHVMLYPGGVRLWNADRKLLHSFGEELINRVMKEDKERPIKKNPAHGSGYGEPDQPV